MAPHLHDISAHVGAAPRPPDASAVHRSGDFTPRANEGSSGHVDLALDSAVAGHAAELGDTAVFTFIPALALGFLERLLTDGPGAASSWRFDRRRPGWYEVAGVQMSGQSPYWLAPRDGDAGHDEWLDLLMTRLAPYLPQGFCYSTVFFSGGRANAYGAILASVGRSLWPI